MKSEGMADFFSFRALYFVLFPLSLSAHAQTLSDRVTGYYGEASVYAEAAHTRTDVANGTTSDDEISLGVEGIFGAELESGANALSALYNAQLETTQEDDFSENNESSSLTGVSNYFYRDPAGRLDLNAGHSIRSVRTDSGFAIDPTDYDTQNAINAGAGLWFYPGDLSTLRFSSQAVRTFEEGDRRDTETLRVAADLERRLSNQSLGSLSASRSWAKEENDDTVLDTVILGYARELETGLFAIGVGGSRADAEYADGTANESDAAVGYMSRSWATSETFAQIRVERSLTSTALDLAIEFPEVDEFPEESIRINELSLEDTLELRYLTLQLCHACDLGFLLSGTIRESQRTGETTHEFRSNVNLGVQVTPYQRVFLAYTWAADADEDADVLFNQVHRFDVGVRQLLAEQTFITVEGRYSFTESRRDIRDRDQFLVRLSLTHAVGITNR